MYLCNVCVLVWIIWGRLQLTQVPWARTECVGELEAHAARPPSCETSGFNYYFYKRLIRAVRWIVVLHYDQCLNYTEKCRTLIYSDCCFDPRVVIVNMLWMHKKVRSARYQCASFLTSATMWSSNKSFVFLVKSLPLKTEFILQMY